MQSKNIHIIAEIAWGHDGSKDQACKLAEAAKYAGANSLSIHITSLPDYIVRYYGNGEGKVSAGREDEDVYEYLEKINLSQDEWIEVGEYVRSQGLELCVMANDVPSFQFAEENLKPEYYVVPPASMVEYELIRLIAETGRPTLFRIGGSYLGEIEKAINIFRDSGNDKIILLHGFQNYPTALEETDLSILPLLKQIFDVEVGLADHVDGSEDIAKVIPAVSVPFGVTYIEKHITLDRARKSEDFESALDPEEFKKCVEYIRAAEIALGSANYKNLNDASRRYRDIVRKRIVFKKKMKKNDVISSSDICFKRCDIGLSLDKLELVTGRKLNCDVEIDEAVTLDKLY